MSSAVDLSNRPLIDADLAISSAFDIICEMVPLSLIELGVAEDIQDHITEEDFAEYNETITDHFYDWYDQVYPDTLYGQNLRRGAKAKGLKIENPAEKSELIRLFYETVDEPVATLAREFLRRKSSEYKLL